MNQHSVLRGQLHRRAARIKTQHPSPLEPLIQHDTLRHALSLLTPLQTLIAHLRLQGLTDGQIADRLKIPYRTVGQHMLAAKTTIAAEIPELRVFLQDRRRKPNRPLPPPPNDLTPEQVAHQLSVDDHLPVSPVTVRRWCRQGRFPNAYRLPTPKRPWRIPPSDL